IIAAPPEPVAATVGEGCHFDPSQMGGMAAVIVDAAALFLRVSQKCNARTSVARRRSDGYLVNPRATLSHLRQSARFQPWLGSRIPAGSVGLCLCNRCISRHARIAMALADDLWGVTERLYAAAGGSEPWTLAIQGVVDLMQADHATLNMH